MLCWLISRPKWKQACRAWRRHMTQHQDLTSWLGTCPNGPVATRARQDTREELLDCGEHVLRHGPEARPGVGGPNSVWSARF